MNRLFEREQRLHLSDKETDRLILKNTRKFSMASIRAGQRMVITCIGEVPDLLRELPISSE
jgi:hypothetical protein